MFKLTQSLQAWNTDVFEKTFKQEIEQLDPAQLPLQQALSLSSYVSTSPFSITILKIDHGDEFIHIKTGIFYTGIIAGCSCADDPTPLDEQNEYCEVQFEVNKQTGETQVQLLSE